MHGKMRILGSVTAAALLMGLVVAASVSPPTTTADLLLNGSTNNAQNVSAIGSCSGTNYLVNGSFEGGFNGGVGANWASFTNGGRAAYGFYDDQWPRVVFDGTHAQLIEINTLGLAAADPDRFAGIYQVVRGASAASIYEFALAGLIRESDAATHQNEDAFRYRVQWGWLQGSNADWTAVNNWQEIPWDRIDDRLSPGPLQTFATQFKATAGQITLFVRVWKKWGNVQRELNVNLDAISLRNCATQPTAPRPAALPKTGGGQGQQVIVAPSQQLVLNNVEQATVTQVQNVTVSVNQQGSSAPAPAARPSGRQYVVRPGDSLSSIAARFHISWKALAQANGITNPNRIYPGMVLQIP